MQRSRGGYKDKYQADLDSASDRAIPSISSISRADVEGHFAFAFTHPLLAPLPRVEVQVIPNEWSSYPSQHSFLAWAITDIPPALGNPLSNFHTQSSGLRVHDALAALSRSFVSALVGGSTTTQHDEDEEDQFMTDIDGPETDDEEDEGDDAMSYDSDEDNDAFGLGNNESGQTHDHVPTAKFDLKTMDRIRRDFRTARASGFKVGVLCGFEDTVENNIVSLSVRVDKLCLPEETLEAWNLNLDDYIVLLIRYDKHYTTAEDALSKAAGMSNMQFRLRKCRRYKPSLQHAIRAFGSGTTIGSKTTVTPDDIESTLSDLSLLSIGQSIDTFMDSDFVPLLKLRNMKGVGWDQAKRELVRLARNPEPEHSNAFTADTDASNKRSHDMDQMKLPAFIANEHLTGEQEQSLPLIAVQFAMRYFVRCTDYCMVCHQQVEANFEALKPYVCGNSLCLFQYMSMGLGPSVNQEIRNQPNVVDLLISFCYAGLQVNTSMNSSGRGVRELPIGLDLQVPKIFTSPSSSMPAATLAGPMHPSMGIPNSFDPNLPKTGEQSLLEQSVGSITVNGFILIDPIKAILDMNTSTFQLRMLEDSGRFKEGNWIAIVATIQSPLPGNIIIHGRVKIILGLTVHFSVVSVVPEKNWQLAENSDAHIMLYNHNLDDLDEKKKAEAILMQLETIPSVATMRSHLAANPDQQIEKWDRLTPAASKLLRWIVASNRSYILQVDECPTEDGEPEPGLARQQEHISGVDGWLQFRFAQGSPEKEVRFQEALRGVNKPHKTILAWHGSTLSNWHSIIRQGLNFEQVNNGRAYGDGVYFGHDFNTSLGYTGSYNRFMGSGSASRENHYWPNSVLKISSAVSLNELVNLPQKFRSNNHFCMVVQHVHWIMARYLFVKVPQSETQQKHSTDSTNTKGVKEFVQDPANEAKGTSGKLFVPLAAIPSSQNQGVQMASTHLKYNALGHQGDSEYEDEDVEDRAFLAMYKEVNDNMLTTSFRPGALDLDTLPRLNPPSYATAQAQKTLAKEIQKLQAAQSSTPIHELGWFIDFDKITNMFHWIVELHSFDQSLPLARDMEKAGVTSIVLELRFGRDFPYSPPFVRVIRPRFLPFAAGGGGNVTAGGAMCMELLTNSGWSPINSLEGVLVQVRLAISNTDPRPARLESIKQSNGRDYGISEAFAAYTRAANTHDWDVPKDLQEATTDMQEMQSTDV